MGVKKLWDVLESCKKTLPLHHLQNKRICIDLSSWVVQLGTTSANKSESHLKDKVYLIALFHRLRALIGLNCSLILVSDGSIPAIKATTFMHRVNRQVEVNQDVSDSEKVVRRRSVSNWRKVPILRGKDSEFSCMINNAKILGTALGIPCLDGLEEAEAQCALLNSARLCDGCFSPDSDIFLFGARTVYRDICLREGYVVCYEMSDIERELGFGRNSLITLSLLLGSDYTNGVYGLGPESACRVVKSIGDKAVLQKVESEGLSFAKNKARKSKKSVQKSNVNKKNTVYNVESVNKKGSAGDYSYLEVINAYRTPKCHAADSYAVHMALVQRPYQRVKVQELCLQNFEWPTEKTDDFILSKIAERELRIFNNLRSISSKLGLNLPLDKMPVKCPVSRVVSARKLNGKELYEVLWDARHGMMKPSLVPADLIKSACPEKIVDFEEDKAQKKLQNCPKPKVKKSTGEESSQTNIDHSLENLLLETESESNVKSGPSVSSSAEATQEITNTRFETTTLLEDEEGSQSGGKYENETIDLLNPSPPGVRFRLEAKRRDDASDRGIIDILELNNSENDMSPEHPRKARELRVFLAGIKD